ncbi:MAG: antitoxin [Thermoanaerobaculia bacterium]|nr:antitoxin [Thermoanaerobaculia bacterium]
MVKTQIQIPDDLYRETKRIAEQYELSFAEVVRRGIERLLPSYPPRRPASGARLPELDLGLVVDPFASPEWRSELHLGAASVAEPETTGPARRKSRSRR